MCFVPGLLPSNKDALVLRAMPSRHVPAASRSCNCSSIVGAAVAAALAVAQVAGAMADVSVTIGIPSCTPRRQAPILAHSWLTAYDARRHAL